MSLSEIEKLLKNLGLTEREIREVKELTTAYEIAFSMITNILERIENYLYSDARIEKLISAFNKVYEKLPNDLTPENKARVALALLLGSREVIEKYLETKKKEQ